MLPFLGGVTEEVRRAEPEPAITPSIIAVNVVSVKERTR